MALYPPDAKPLRRINQVSLGSSAMSRREVVWIVVGALMIGARLSGPQTSQVDPIFLRKTSMHRIKVLSIQRISAEDRADPLRKAAPC
jgi:hypothetical protein